jgi:hypothetical protein
MKKKSTKHHKKTQSSCNIEKFPILNKSLNTTKEKRYNTEANFMDTNTELSTGESSSHFEVLQQNLKQQPKLNKPKSERITRNITFELQKSSPQSSLINKETKEQKEKRLKKQIKYLKIYIILQFIVGISDFVCVGVFPKIFLNIFNVIALILILILDCYMYRQFQLGAKEVNKQYYKYIKKIILIVSIIIGIFFLDMIYEIIIQMLINSLIEFDSNEIFIWIIFILLYVVLNISFPVLIITQLTDIKKNIKQIGKLKGKDFSVSSSNYVNSNTEFHIVEQNKTEF